MIIILTLIATLLLKGNVWRWCFRHLGAALVQVNVYNFMLRFHIILFLLTFTHIFSLILILSVWLFVYFFLSLIDFKSLKKCFLLRLIIFDVDEYFLLVYWMLTISFCLWTYSLVLLARSFLLLIVSDWFLLLSLLYLLLLLAIIASFLFSFTFTKGIFWIVVILLLIFLIFLIILLFLFIIVIKIDR